MENSPKTEPETDFLEVKPEAQTVKKSRKVDQKTVVKVKIDGNGGKQRSEGPPSDFWSWRKYGQKPIKGSPHPRGYYKCSTSKGCSAKKQVERCKTDASLLLITYTSSHNHPGPDLQTPNQSKNPETESTEEISTTPDEQQQQHQHEQDEEKTPPLPASSNPASDEEPGFHYLESSLEFTTINQEDNPFIIDQLDNTHELLAFVFVEEPIFYPQIMNFSTPSKSDDNDFFDELEELPSSSSLNSFMRSSLRDERILLQPS